MLKLWQARKTHPETKPWVFCASPCSCIAVQVKDYRVAGAQSLLKPQLVLPSGILPQGCRDRVPVDRRRIYTLLLLLLTEVSATWVLRFSVWLLHSGLHTSHTLPIDLSWRADKWSNRKGSVYTYFYVFTSHHHWLQNLGLSVQGIKLQRHNYWTSCCSGERITVPQLLWHLITSINILIYHKQDSLVGQQMFRIIKGSWAWKECSVIKRHIWLYSQSEKEEPKLRGDHVFCFQAQGSFRYNILAEKVTI